MTPAFFTTVADRLYAHRSWFLGVPIVGFAIVVAALSLASSGAVNVVGVLAGPVIFVPWALFCACLWFHPQHGNLQPSGKRIGKLPQLLQVAIRWYAAVFLALFLAFGALVLPVFAVAFQ
jgi:hypothetical protein